LESLLKNLGKSIKPSKEFEIILKNKVNMIYESKFKKSKKENFFLGIFRMLKESLNNSILYFFGGAFGIFLIMPIFSVIITNPSSASSGSLIRNINGEITLIRNNQKISLSEEKELLKNDIIITGEKNDAEIVFFDGSILRISENTKIKLNNMEPNPLLFTTGSINIYLEFGNIWMTTFQTNTENKLIRLDTPHSSMFPNKARFSVSYKNDKEYILNTKNNLDIKFYTSSGSKYIIMKENEFINYSPFKFETDSLSSVKLNSYNEWIVLNLKKDEIYKKEYFNKIKTSLKDKYLLEENNNQVNSFFDSDPTEEEVEKLINDVNKALTISKNKKVNITITKKTPTPLPTILAKEKEVISNVKTKKAIKIKTYNTEKKDLKSLPENKKTTLSPISKTDEVKALSLKYQKEQKQKNIEKLSNKFIEKINVYSFESSRITQTTNILKSIKNDKESIELLKSMENKSPKDIRKYIRQKRIKIEKDLLNENPENILLKKE
jgi:hypothetical protein